jgi:hypothetical protein
MKILYAIAVISFAALVWAALAIARHVRKSSARAAAQPAADAELLEAIDMRLSEIVRSPAQPLSAGNSTDAEQDVSYFNRDGAAVHSDKVNFVDPPPPIEPITVDPA